MLINKKINFREIGINAAKLFSEQGDKMAVYEKAASYMYNILIEVVGDIRLYLVDEKEEVFKEEMVYSYEGFETGYDFIPFYQLPDIIMKDMKHVKYYDKNTCFLIMPLTIDNKIMGLLYMKIITNIDEEDIVNIRQMTDVISLGLFHSMHNDLYSTSDLLTEAFLEINSNLQNIKEQESLITVFMNLILKRFKFDRTSIFLLDENEEILYGKCIIEKGEEFLIKEKPKLPKFDNDYVVLKNTVGYWFLLRTNTRVVGAVLCDNIYSLHKISEQAIDILRILCSHFASAIENIRLFTDLQNAALHDKLTSLKNRRYFEKQLKKFNQYSLADTFIIGDVNGLKVTNDVFGHEAGDSLLVTVAEILQSVSSPQDEVIRLGGDEFLIILHDSSNREAEKICSKIKQKCSEVNDTKVNISIALGYASRKDNNEDFKVVLRRAEDMMYHNKLRESKEFRDALIISLMKTLGEKGAENSGHAVRMVDLALKLGRKMGLSKHELSDLKMLAMLHDIGKVAVSKEILNKKGPLNDEEWYQVKKHAEAGYRIAHESFEFSPIANYILYHHERWDGKGYPLGMKASEIPLLSRIIAVVDAYDILTHDQVYKSAISHSEAIAELQRNAGSQFDPQIVDLFSNLKLD
ncbi:bifunctional diguanylate cyclase/phosphohydrolase [Natronospora cellulosivora (SeqCode)]